MSFAHEHVRRVAEIDGDPRALGGAVTVALFGHWEHDGPCPVPHHTTTESTGTGFVATVRFEAADDQVEHVRRQVDDALGLGHLVGPDGRETHWRLDEA